MFHDRLALRKKRCYGTRAREEGTDGFAVRHFRQTHLRRGPQRAGRPGAGAPASPRSLVEIVTAGRAEVDLRDQGATKAYLKRTAPDIVIVAVAKVGGILANATYPVEFLNDNLLIESNSSLYPARRRSAVCWLVLSYPREAPQPMREDALLTGPLEPTNKWYAIANSRIMLCQAYREQYGRAYISAMPTNLYGPGDNFDSTTATSSLR